MESTKDGIVRIVAVGGVVVVNFQRGRIREEREILKALEDLGKHIESHPGAKVLLDMGNIEYLSSAGLGNLVGLLKKSRRSSGLFRLCCLQEPILELFEVMRLTKIFEIFETEALAIASFQGEKQPDPVH